jgi:hypothetical protein
MPLENLAQHIEFSRAVRCVGSEDLPAIRALRFHIDTNTLHALLRIARRGSPGAREFSFREKFEINSAKHPGAFRGSPRSKGPAAGPLNTLENY